MKVTVSCIGRFHHFDLARQLSDRGLLHGIYTGYPRWKLRGDRLERKRVFSFPPVHALFMAYNRAPIFGITGMRTLEALSSWTHDNYVSANLEPCDAFIGLSGHNTKAGRRAKRQGAIWVCDRGSTHIVNQNRILAEESQRWNVPFHSASRYTIEHELAEYQESNYISIPSRFVEQTFVDQGIPREKLRRIPYGVELRSFHAVSRPAEDRFDIIFVGQVSVRKGIPYLIEAFRRFRHPKKSLTIIGVVQPDFRHWVSNIKDDNVKFLGHLPQSQLKEYLSRSHAFVLPSVEEGLALVQAQALACGCPVICTPNTGGEDIFRDGEAGFVVPVRNALAIVDRLERLAGDVRLAQEMRVNAVKTVAGMGGWTAYGDSWAEFLKSVVQRGQLRENSHD